MQKVDQACYAHVLRYGVVKEVSIVIAHIVAVLHYMIEDQVVQSACQL